MVEGVTNGVISKYDKNCLDSAHQNAKDQIKGNAPSDHSGFKCYKDGKLIDCSSIREDGETEKAEEEWEALKKTCTQASVCPYGGILLSTEECSCYSAPNCTGSYGGYPLANGTQSCYYYSAPNCTGSYGGYPLANGTQSCHYYSAPNCDAKCTYGGTPKANGTQDCNCDTYTPMSGISCVANGSTSGRSKQKCTISGGKGPYSCKPSYIIIFDEEPGTPFSVTSNTFDFSFPKPRCRDDAYTTIITCTDAHGSSATIRKRVKGSRNCK